MQSYNNASNVHARAVLHVQRHHQRVQREIPHAVVQHQRHQESTAARQVIVFWCLSAHIVQHEQRGKTNEILGICFDLPLRSMTYDWLWLRNSPIPSCRKKCKPFTRRTRRRACVEWKKRLARNSPAASASRTRPPTSKCKPGLLTSLWLLSWSASIAAIAGSSVKDFTSVQIALERIKTLYHTFAANFNLVTLSRCRRDVHERRLWLWDFGPKCWPK